MFWRPDYILRHRDGSWAYHYSWDVDAWWYCGEFKVTAYQFVLESAYVNTDGTFMGALAQGTAANGASFSTSRLFARDVEVNGTGRADVSQPCAAQGNYISSMVVQEREGNSPKRFTCACGSGRGIVAEDAYKIVAADNRILKMRAPIYVPGLEEEGEELDENGQVSWGNADFIVRDTGQAIMGRRIDVFVGEGAGILSEKPVPAIQYISSHHYRRGVPYGEGALQPLAVYQKSSYHWFFHMCD
jgi:3D (Asp-Asp-Asp) domain-containing protein